MESTLRLLGHILRISARRDRTEINVELVEAMDDLFRPRSLKIFRCYIGDEHDSVYDCAGIGANGVYLRNAYLPDLEHCAPVDSDPLLLRCANENLLQVDSAGPRWQRIVFPIGRDHNPQYLIDLILPDDLPSDQRVVLMGLIEFLGKHIALLDYGEADTLTGLPNRKTFDKHLFEVLGGPACDSQDDSKPTPHRRHPDMENASHWLAVCDIDKFKSINDSHGHLIGDEVLVMLAQLMRRSFRFADQIFRFGGEEFVVVLQPTGVTQAQRIFERFRSNVEAHRFSQVGRVTISIGFTRLTTIDTPSEVLDRADEALYFAKEHGRNQVARFEDLVARGEVAARPSGHGEVEFF